MGAQLSEDEIQKALDFCVNLFSPTTPEQHERVRNKLKLRLNINAAQKDQIPEDGHDCPTKGEETEQELDEDKLLDVHAPLINPSALTRFLKNRFRGLSFSSGPPSPVSPTLSSIPPLSPSGTSESANSDWEVESVSSVRPLEPSLSPKSYFSKREDEDTEMKRVLEKVNARRVIHAEHGEGLNSMEQETVAGFVVRLIRGQLGLVRANVS